MSSWKVYINILLISVTSLVISTCIAGVALTAVIEADNATVEVLYGVLKSHVPTPHVHIHEQIQPNNIKLISSIIFALSTLKMLFSVLQIFGIKMREPVFLALYLGYGVLVTILLMTSGLLLLLGYSWYAAITTYIFAIIYMFCLVKVYNEYESMCRADVSDGNEHEPLEEAII